jgi:pimeloyl-ACP methyl ester carboxylesterase
MEPRVLTFDTAGSGDPVVLVPGGLTGWLSWIPHQQRLSDTWQVTRVQPINNELGSAGVVGDPSYSRETARESLRMTFDRLGLEWAHLAGWSAGGQQALDFTMAYPERVRSLTLVEPASYWVLGLVGFGDPRLETVNELTDGFAGRDVTEGDLAMFLAFAGFAASPEEARAMPQWDRWVPHRQALSWLGGDFLTSDATLDDLRAIACPTLAVKGTVTETWEMRVVDTIGGTVPNGRVLELEGDHACHIQSIDRFLEEFEAQLRVA